MSSESHEPAAERLRHITAPAWPSLDDWANLFRCSVCSEWFVTNKTLERPAACPHCGVSYTQTKIDGKYIAR